MTSSILSDPRDSTLPRLHGSPWISYRQCAAKRRSASRQTSFLKRLRGATVSRRRLSISSIPKNRLVSFVSENDAWCHRSNPMLIATNCSPPRGKSVNYTLETPLGNSRFMCIRIYLSLSHPFPEVSANKRRDTADLSLADASIANIRNFFERNCHSDRDVTAYIILCGVNIHSDRVNLFNIKSKEFTLGFRVIHMRGQCTTRKYPNGPLH